MRKRLLVLLMAVMMVASAVPAFAVANDPHAADAPGQLPAYGHCFEHAMNQQHRGVEAGGGPKEGAPTNCDHLHQEEGSIGNQTGRR